MNYHFYILFLSFQILSTEIVVSVNEFNIIILQKLSLHVGYYPHLFFISPLSADTAEHKSNIVDAYVSAILRRFEFFAVMRYFVLFFCYCSKDEDVE